MAKTAKEKIADSKSDDHFKPSRLLSPELKLAIAEAVEERKADSIDPKHALKPSDGWKQQREIWNASTDDERRDYLYGMVLFDGIPAETKKGLNLIAKFFGIKVSALEPYMDVIEMGDAARVLKITRNQLQSFLIRDDVPMGKFFLGKQFAYQVNDPAHEGVEAVKDDGNINITVIGGEAKTEAKTDELTHREAETSSVKPPRLN
jgi:hypothetical protein